MAKGAKYRRRSKPKSAKFKKSRQTTKPSPTFKVKVKKVIRSQEETKMVFNQNEYHILHNSAVDSNDDWYRVYPQMGIGNDAQRRIGNEIYPTRLSLEIDVGLRAADARAVDLTVVVLIMKDLRIRGTQTTGAGSITSHKEYFLLDEATPTYFGGNINSAHYPWNNDQVKGVARKFVRLCKGTGLNTGPPTYPAADGDGFTDTPTKLSHTFKFNLPVPKILKYENSASAIGGQAWPTNDHYFYAVGYFYNTVDGVPDVANRQIVVNSRSRMWYKDG